MINYYGSDIHLSILDFVFSAVFALGESYCDVRVILLTVSLKEFATQILVPSRGCLGI